MKTQTIWESASRPLFVRSVWIDTTHEGRGAPHRHFILDYDQQEHLQYKRKPIRSAVSPERVWRRESLQHSVSCDLSELSTSYESEETTDKLLLVGSAKIKLQQQPLQHQNRQHVKLLKFYRRPSFTKHTKRQTTGGGYEYQMHRRMRELQELYSRHSSSQDIHSTLSNACSNPEDRLAERVLNWLDLAGKSAIMKSNESDAINDNYMMEHSHYQHPLQQQQSLERKQQQYQQQLQQQQQKLQKQALVQRANMTTTRVRRKAYGQSKHSSVRVTNPVQQCSTRRSQSDAVKPITIIFNRDGFPVRFNRPARNIDLCTLASNAVTTQRLTGTLASARLYQDKQAVAYNTGTAKRAATKGTTQRTVSTRSMNTARMRSGEAEKSTTQPSQKRLHEDLVVGQVQDSKRQLHIFMPSLPKKGITSPSVLSNNCGADDSSVSVLSRSFNESCKL